jgi:hypothetical protein
MVNTRFDGGGILARKLNTFLPLTPDELKCLDEIQSQPFPVKARQATHPGGSDRAQGVLAPSRLGMQL